MDEIVTPPERSPRDILNIMFRHKSKVLTALLVSLVLATLATLLMPRAYQSDARLLVRLGRESVTLDPTAATGHVVNMTQTRESEISSELEILKSRELAEKVVDAVPALLEGQRDREAAIDTLQQNLGIEVVKGTNVVSLSFEAGTPHLAQSVVAKLIELYLDKHIAVHRTSGAYDFFQAETKNLRDELAEKEGRLRDLKNRAKIGSLDDQRRILLNRIGALQGEIQENHASLSASKAKVQSMKKMLGALPETTVTQETTGLPDSAVDGMRQRIYELQLKEQELLSKFSEQSPPVQEIRRQIGEAQDLLARESQKRTQVTRGLSAPYQQLSSDLLAEQASLSSLAAKAKALSGQLGGVRNEITALNGTEVQLAQIERDVETLRTNYRKYADNLEQARIDQALETEKISNISVVQQATLLPQPVRPRPILNLALGLLFGIVLGLGLAIGSEFMDHTMRTSKDVEEKLDVTTLVTIPDLSVGRSSAWRSRKAPSRRALASATPEARAAQLADPGVLLPAGVRQYSETLWDRLVVSTNGTFKTPCLLAVTSCGGGEGTTTVATALASTIRRSGHRRVLFVDAHRLLRSSETGDFALPPEAIRVVDEAPLVDAQVRDLPLPADLRSLLQGEDTFVLIDTPPLLESTAAVRICSLASGVVLVVQAERTRWEVAREAKDILNRGNARLLGVVLNRRRFHVPEWLYHRI